MSTEIQKREITPATADSQVETWKARSWCKRIDEPVALYSIFIQYLESEEVRAYKWVRDHTKEQLQSYPKGYQSKMSVRKAAKEWRWEIRKNDYLNQVYDIARKPELEALQDFSVTFGEGFGYLKAIFVRSLKKKWDDGYEMDMDEILQLSSKLADIQMHLDDKEERRKHRIGVESIPTAKIKKLLESINSVEDTKVIDVESE